MMNDRARNLPAEDAEPRAEDPLRHLLERPIDCPVGSVAPLQVRFDVPTVAVLAGMLEGRPLVVFRGQPTLAAVEARTTVDLLPEHVGGEVLLVFEGADPARPIITGRIRGAGTSPSIAPGAPQGAVDVDVDGQHVVVAARQQLTLRCGRASITLTRAGKILVDGAYVQVVSSGVNRIKGGSVQIN